MKKTIIISVLAVVLILIVVMVNDDKDNGKLKVGVMGPLSGQFAQFGEEGKRGIESVGAKNIEFIYGDDQCDPAVAITSFRKLIDIDKVGIVIGPGCGSPQEAIAPLVKEKNILNILPSAATEELYERGGQNIFNIQYSLEKESSFIAEKMYEMGYKKVAIISYNNNFSKVHHDTFTAKFKGIIAKDIVINDNRPDISSDILLLKNLNVDAVFSTDVAFFFADGLEKMRRLGISVPVFSQYAVELPAIRSLVENVIYSFPDDVNEAEGAIYGMYGDSAELLTEMADECDSDVACIKSKFVEKFDNGVAQRNIILKQIKNGVPVKI